ncbi:DUF445 domain-containing protein [Natranaerobius trueperi]|uniref:DUF445 domain-containing protein n=1 Tax=Natranaerobius trueperi TaxID=759412 RepID=A0A226BXD3_9FIRM|nr:DUF445 family protein [Natranaerobius trueperi]OWZ82859.1 hypothetical protein CDO51_11735 [Natranaerobius trueperi]
MLSSTVIFIPIISSLIGWLTNFIAIKLLFWPHEKISLPILDIEIQGLLSRRKSEIAQSIGGVVAKELLPSGKLIEEIDEYRTINKIQRSVEKAIKEKLQTRLRYLPEYIRERVIENVRQSIGRNIETSLHNNFQIILQDLTSYIDIEKLIKKEIMNLDTREVEKLVLRVARKEFKFIETLGSILGFVVGLFQLIFLYLFY